jgi:4a-hydroxytetrahydrobiopterin dehydratase
MKPFSAPKRISHAKARNAALLNQFATPGLGSLLAGHWLAGLGQLLVFLAGFVIYCAWAFNNLAKYFSLMSFSDAPPENFGWNRTATTGVALCVAAWLWSLVTSLSLLRQASHATVEALQLFGASLVKMDEASLGPALAAVPHWRRTGPILSRTYLFKDFPGAMKFVNAVAGLAEQVQHHPDIDVRWNQVTLALTTHEAGGLTAKDFALARECDAQAGES